MTRERRRPMNVFVGRGSSAERLFRERAHPISEAIVPGIPPTPAHDLKNHGGKIIQNLRFMNFYVGADAWNAGDMGNIDKALAAAMSDRNLNNIMAQYFSGPISSTFDGSQNLPGPAPAIISQGDVEQLASTLYTQKKFGGHDLTSTVFNFLLPPRTVLNTDSTTTGGLRRNSGVRNRIVIPHDEDDSLHGLGGYHGSVHVSPSDTVYYSIGVYSETEADGTVNGIPVFDEPWKNVVATFYHELNEARTDADVEDAIRAGNDPNAENFLGWTSDQGEECGDFPVFEAGNDLTEVFQEVQLTDKSGSVPVQFQYSNAVHGPEGPIAQPHSKR
jgi:hypothetical protein